MAGRDCAFLNEGVELVQVDRFYLSPEMQDSRRDCPDQGARTTGKLRKRIPKMIARTPIITAYHAMIQIRAAAPASGFHKRRPAKIIEARPIRIRNHSPLTSRRILIASAISVAPIINDHAAM